MSTFRGRQRNMSTRIYGISLTEQFASPHAIWFKIQMFTYSIALLPDYLQHSIEKVNQYNVSSIGLFAATEGRGLLILSQSCVWLMVCSNDCLLYCGFGRFSRAAPYGEILLMHVSGSSSSVWKNRFKPALTWRQRLKAKVSSNCIWHPIA